MSEITSSKYSEAEIDHLIKTYASNDNGKWERHQTWKATRLLGVRILYAFKRGKSVFQGDMKAANIMIAFLEKQRREKVETNTTTKVKNTSTQTEDDWVDSFLNEKRCHKHKTSTKER